MNRHLQSFLAAIVFFASVHLQAVPEYVPSQELAQGQSLAGGYLLNDSLYSNPASSAFTRIYQVEGSYVGDGGFGASVLDTKTSSFGGALGYFRKTQLDTDGFVQGLKIGISNRLGSNLAFGVSGKWIWSPQENVDSLKDIDVGLMLDEGWLNLGVLVRNVLGGSEAFGLGTEWGIGAKMNWENTVFLSAATYGSFEAAAPHQWGLGAEYVSPYYFSLKAGYRIRPLEDFGAWSTGVSFLAPKLSVHYSVEFAGSSDGEPQHNLAMSVMM